MQVGVSRMPYQTLLEAAPNADVLLEFLLSQEKAGENFVYRGQLREWPGPLLPSLYRRSIQLKRVFTERSHEYVACLRHCGREFVEMRPDSFVAKMLSDWPMEIRSRHDVQTIMGLASDYDFSKAICDLGHEAVFRRTLPAGEEHLLRPRLPFFSALIDELHRSQIRQLAFLQPYGYVLGMTLAQQYGFASELLDFTSSPAVAMFFATHSAPEYLDASKRLSEGLDVGVVYRLPSSEGNIRWDRIDNFNYYSCPSQVHLSDVCRRFEDKSSPEMHDQLADVFARDKERIGISPVNAMLKGVIVPESLQMLGLWPDMGPFQDPIHKYLHLFFNSRYIRYYRLLDVPMGTFDRSRLGRQSAVSIIPDELRKTEDDGDGEYASFQAVEDVSRRANCEKFYFTHTNEEPDLGRIDREYLWPVDQDFFKQLSSRPLDPRVERFCYDGQAIPKRLDLVSSGFVLG